MAHRDLREEEIWNVLAEEQVVRIAFHDGESHYLVPLGYVRLQAALCGVAGRGRKTDMAEARPSVAFQVDSSSSTGLFEWKSVTGEGRFEIVTNNTEKQEVLAALQPVMAEAPAWWQREQASRMAAGELEVWRVTPTTIEGRSYEQSSSVTA